MKQLFDVEVAQNVIVLAETKEEARRLARDAVRGLGSSDFDFFASEMSSLPGDWEEDALPFGGEGTKTIAEYVAEGAAPAYVAAKKLWEERRAQLRAAGLASGGRDV